MKQVMNSLKRRDAEERIPVLKLEIDYELTTLHDAILLHDDTQMDVSKSRLEKLRVEKLRLEA